MIGNEQEVKRNVQLAYSYYRQVSNQPWGTIHTMITDYFLSKKSNLIQNALRMSEDKGYQYEIRLLKKMGSLEDIDPTQHNGHFLLFP